MDALHAPDIARLLRICERIGYGRVMQIAANAWYKKDPIGALTVGPCAYDVDPER